MRKMGSKAGAKELMHAAGVPVVPGYTGEDQSPRRCSAKPTRIGYPLMIKAAHGGGGKGMRIVRAPANSPPNLESCQREARNAFGRDRVLLERYVEQPRHIEIQVFADAHGNAHPPQRARMLGAAPLPEGAGGIALAVPHAGTARGDGRGRGAGRARDRLRQRRHGRVHRRRQDGGFYFMEINTRLQVEHPVTEMVTGLDLVEWQLRVAAGEAAAAARRTRSRRTATRSKCACTPRIRKPASCPAPASSSACACRRRSQHVRIDSGVVEGDTVTIFYDPMIAKLIVHDADRPRALARLREALAAVRHRRAEVEHRVPRAPGAPSGRRRAARIDTGYLDRHLDEFLPARRRADDRDGPARSPPPRRSCWRRNARPAQRAPRSDDPHLALGHRRRLAPGPRRPAQPGLPAARATPRTARARQRRRLPDRSIDGRMHARSRARASTATPSACASTASARALHGRWSDAAQRRRCMTASAACACSAVPMYRHEHGGGRRRRRPRARADAGPRRAWCGPPSATRSKPARS